MYVLFLSLAPQTELTNKAGLVTYFQRAVSTFQSLPTYDWLAADGIVPKLNATYTRAQILSALTKAYGFTPIIKCRSGALNEVWYYYNSKGGIVDGSMIKADAVGRPGNCDP
jgi:ribonuclease T2